MGILMAISNHYNPQNVYVLLIFVCITKYLCNYYLFDFVLSLPSNTPEILNTILKCVIKPVFKL
jgi:hypothetical protein